MKFIIIILNLFKILQLLSSDSVIGFMLTAVEFICGLSCNNKNKYNKYNSHITTLFQKKKIIHQQIDSMSIQKFSTLEGNKHIILLLY